MTIDVHAHVFPPAYMRFVSTLKHITGSAAEAIYITLHDPQMNNDPAFQGAFDERIELMDKAGIDIQVLSFSAPNIWYPDPGVRSDIVRVFNDSCAEMMKSYPGRFRFFANVPLPYVDQAIAEATRAYDELGAMGIGTCTQFADLPVDDPRFDPFYAFMNERKGVLFFHPDGYDVPARQNDYGMGWAVDATFQDTRVLLRLIYSSLLDRFPNITWIVPHLGGIIPFLIGRVDSFWRNNSELQKRLPQPPSSYLHHNNLFVDTINPQRSAFTLAREVFGVDRLVFGSDFPYVARHDLSMGLRLLQEAGLSDAEREGVRQGHIAARIH